MNEIIRVQDGAPRASEDPASQKKDFKGYSLEDLRYRRALIALKKDMARSKMLFSIDKARKNRFGGSDGSSSKLSRAGGLAARIFSGLNYLDYMMMGMSLFSYGKKFYRFFRGKKK